MSCKGLIVHSKCGTGMLCPTHCCKKIIRHTRFGTGISFPMVFGNCGISCTEVNCRVIFQRKFGIVCCTKYSSPVLIPTDVCARGLLFRLLHIGVCIVLYFRECLYALLFLTEVYTRRMTLGGTCIYRTVGRRKDGEQKDGKQKKNENGNKYGRKSEGGRSRRGSQGNGSSGMEGSGEGSGNGDDSSDDDDDDDGDDEDQEDDEEEEEEEDDEDDTDNVSAIAEDETEDTTNGVGGESVTEEKSAGMEVSCRPRWFVVIL